MSVTPTGASSFGFSVWSGRPSSMDRPHAHDDVELNLATGDLEYVIRGGRVLVPAGSLVLFWASQPHQLVESAPDAEVWWLTIPLKTVLEWQLPTRFVERLLRGDLVLTPARGLLFDATVLDCWHNELGGSEFAAGTARRDIEAHLRRLAEQDPDPAGPASARSGELDHRVAVVARMASFVADNAHRPLRVAEVADAVHLHPQYAMTLFKRVLGVSIGDYLTTCRIHEAQRLLLTSDQPIGLIAESVGYSSLSQFYEKFRRVAGTSPALYRRRRVERS